MFRFFTSDLRRNLIKILCLTIGLAVGFVIVAKVFFETTYDSFYDDSDRIYYIASTVEYGGRFMEWTGTSGAIGKNISSYVPQVERVARVLPVWRGGEVIKTESGDLLRFENCCLADSGFFDIFPTQILSGDPRHILSEPAACMIPQSLADAMGGDVIGQSISCPELDAWIGQTLFRIGGVYKDFPPNSTLLNGIIVSMATGPEIFGASESIWVGNDRFTTYVKLIEGATAGDIDPLLIRMLYDNVDEETLRSSDYRVLLRPVSEFHERNDGIGSSLYILAVLAVLLIISAALNYLLVVLGQIPSRSREMAVRKCYGTSDASIFVRMTLEGIFFMGVSIALAVLVVFCFPELSRELLGRDVRELFAAPGLWMITAVIGVLILLVSSVIPGVIYSRTPVARAFRISVRGYRIRKLILLSVQFLVSGMLMCLMVLVVRQYVMILSLDYGIDHRNMAVARLKKVNAGVASRVVLSLEQMPGIEGVSTSATYLLGGSSGNLVSVDGHGDTDLAVADMYETNPDLFALAGMRFLQGGTFREKADSTVFEVIVDERFAGEMERLFGWDRGNIVGRGFRITEHKNPYNKEFTIVGVVNNVRRGMLEAKGVDVRPTVYFPGSGIYPRMYVRFARLDSESLREAQDLIDRLAPGGEIYLEPVSVSLRSNMAPIRLFATAVGIVGSAIFVITLIGLWGFTTDEVVRRSREIAVRRLTGTSVRGIVRLFCLEVLVVAFPALVAGGALALVVGRRFLAQYSERVSLSPGSMLVCLAVIAAVIVAVISLNVASVARDNPYRHLRSE